MTGRDPGVKTLSEQFQGFLTFTAPAECVMMKGGCWEEDQLRLGRIELDDELDGKEESRLIEATRRRIAIRIAQEMDSLIDALFDIANNIEEDAKVRLSAINMLLERSLPKLGVEHTSTEAIEENANSRAIRTEIENLLLGDDEDDGPGLAGVPASGAGKVGP